MHPGITEVRDWFERQGWEAFPFQEAVWNAYLEGKSGLIHSATGTGKTLAAWMGPVAEALAAGEATGPVDREDAPPLRVLWITPLRALAADTAASLQWPAESFHLPWSVELRTGDTTQSVRAKQKKQLPTALVTTPESLTLMLTREDATELFSDLRLVVVDEWHELMSTKRGVQTELALARIRAFKPELRVWGISATLGNLRDAMETLLGLGREGELVQGVVGKPVVIDTILPTNIDRFPWAGHFGTQMIPRVIEAIDEGGTCLIFTNTRAQAEIWYQSILQVKAQWKDVIALHHGSLSREVRDEVELGLKSGRLRAVVCTSSLDLGVDFTPVDRVLQVGTPKGVARLLQRAGRSGHQPGVPSRVTCVPTHAFELLDIAAARNAALAGKIEAREGVNKPLDVLAQHLVTIATGTGFRAQDLFREVQCTQAYKTLSQEEWDWTLDFVVRGGESLRAYPEYHRVVLGTDGVYRVEDADIAKRHRMSVGTIVSDEALNVQYLKGGKLGTVEESFLARLRPGDRFIFAGRPLEFVRIKDMTAWVRRASSVSGAVPRWMGGRLPLSSELALAIREELERAGNGELASPEMKTLGPILELQARWSAIPALSDLLIERVETREGHHLFFYPFEGRLVHQGMAALFGYRISQLVPITFTFAANDYGFELLAPEEAPLEEAIAKGLLSPENLGADIVASLNSAELARRQFREIARIAGLVFQGFPGMNKSAKQLQASSGLFYDVFARYDPNNLLLRQADREVLERQLEQSRLSRSLGRLSQSNLLITHPKRPSPMCFPILVDRLRETVTSENIHDRIEKMASQLELEAGDKIGAPDGV
ncbi:ligase-associated DNA damage response DEXH box helicase [Fimbriimonas ginsengisoli]|uniref:DEAD/DEAH box helicase domain-containing protein n=1 Tax=Fimbriimonas ginsengisoli Gsoil 348 TaxID=661478 RepID=A0A068NX93_FIMGI|nr:ligase-associated DNA damage response DEXH box helicase [Fimbriimonas ginsengisoli]AIE87405.1 DEAD/DEAH box helicase domain-containing protein [Fimbriimonas ginsengisoli Gsoil 348]